MFVFYEAEMRKKLEWKHIFDLMSYHPIVAYRELLKLFYRLFSELLAWGIQ